jgi:wobble nucleotide-excising tRNase
MFVEQIKHIGSVGRFRNCAAEGDVTWRKFTLLFGENGRGKTTLCSILRSLQTNNPDLIAGRKTLGEGKEPNVVLKLNNGMALFKEGSWKAPAPNLRIFDAQYVADNVYLGDAIGTSQRRNLCNVILGRNGVVLAEQYHKLDNDITLKSNEIREERNVLQAFVPRVDLDAFIKLEPDPEIDRKIDESRKEVEGVRLIDNLRSLKGPEKLELPRLPTKLGQVLSRTLNDVSREAESKVRAHLQAHGMEGNEQWLSTGLVHQTNDECPFCGQSTSGLSLIEAYHAYFNASYTAFRLELDQYQEVLGRHYSDDRIELLKASIQSNTTASERWANYVVFEQPRLAERDVGSLLKMYRTEMQALLEAKARSPMDSVQLSPSYKEAQTLLAALHEEIATYNQAVEEANVRIEAFKGRATPAALVSASNELDRLGLTKKRYWPSAVQMCDGYTRLLREKDELEVQKSEARSRLDAYSNEVADVYEKAVNGVLKRFFAGFRLIRTKVEYGGRIANSTFCVVINDVPVDMGNSETPLKEPSFKNTLSAGDRSTLALAFFLAELKASADRTECTVVFDDPFNSQDHNRRTRTTKELRRCGRDVSQVVIMSHDKRFLHDVWPLLPTDQRKALQIFRFGQKDSFILEWNIEADNETDDDANRRTLVEYYNDNEGDPRDVIQKLRPVLETHLKYAASQVLQNVKGLGNMLEKIRETESPPILAEAYDDIDDVNTYTLRYMHGDRLKPDHPPITRTELQEFVGVVLDITGALTSA